MRWKALVVRETTCNAHNNNVEPPVILSTPITIVMVDFFGDPEKKCIDLTQLLLCNGFLFLIFREVTFCVFRDFREKKHEKHSKINVILRVTSFFNVVLEKTYDLTQLLLCNGF